MHQLYNAILIRYSSSVTLPYFIQSDCPRPLLATIQRDISQLGYAFDDDVIEALTELPPNLVAEFYHCVIAELKQIVGSNVTYTPLSKTFLAVPEDATSEMPATTSLIQLSLGTLNDVGMFVHDCLAANSSISEQKLDYIKQLYLGGATLSKFVPDEIPMKEHLAFAAAMLMRHDQENAVDMLNTRIKTATDVLRVATMLCGGDVSLKSKTRYKFPRSQRAMLLILLNSIKYPLEDMMRHRSKWLRLGEAIHPTEYQKKIPNAASAFHILRNDHKSISTFNSRVEKAMVLGRNNGKSDIIAILAPRPGEFARRIDWLLCHQQSAEVDKTFRLIAKDITTKMLLTLESHLIYRTTHHPTRYYAVGATIDVSEEHRPPLALDAVCGILLTIRDTLGSRFANREPLGATLIDPSLVDYVLPLSERDASSNITTLGRGSRVSIPESNTIRLFLWWRNPSPNDIVDVDLSAVCFDASWGYHSHLSFTALEAIGGKHSGDKQDAPAEEGAAEFIDIDRPTATTNGIRYIAMNVLSYNGQHFTEFPCHAGVMQLDEDKLQSAYNPTNVTHKFDVTTKGNFLMPLVFDLVENTMLWCDAQLPSSRYATVESQISTIINTTRACDAMRHYKPTAEQLFMHHVNARSTTIDTVRDITKRYDTVIDASTATNTTAILSEWIK